MSIRKMITFPERGAALLAEATGGARERAAGEYLSAVLAQRQRAWMGAIDRLVAAGYTPRSIHSHVTEFHRKGTTLEEMLRFAGDPEGRWLYDLVLEYDAQNRALLATLEAQGTE